MIANELVMQGTLEAGLKALEAAMQQPDLSPTERWDIACQVVDEYRRGLRRLEGPKPSKDKGTFNRLTMKRPPMGLGRRLREARIRKGVSQQVVCEQAFQGDLTNAMLSRWELGQRWPTDAQIAVVAQFYGVSEQWLLTGEDTPREDMGT